MNFLADISDVRRFANACDRASMGKADLVRRQNAANAKAQRFSPDAIEIDAALARDLSEAAEYLRKHVQFLETKRERAA